MAAPKKEPIVPQKNIKAILDRNNVKRSLRWLSQEANISYALLHQICNGKRRIQDAHMDRIMFAFNRFNIDVTREEVFV
tara:strand:+ start:1441 stop:1677 length:237 start_codon:yes stop_codon:yes gene_type:complete